MSNVLELSYPSLHSPNANFNLLPKDNFLNMNKLKAFAKITISLCDRVETTMGVR